jgi:hypothetical protein
MLLVFAISNTNLSGEIQLPVEAGKCHKTRSS